MAPMALNSVAPYRRAASRNALAENAGSSTRLARAATDPSVGVRGRVDVEQRQRRHQPVVGGEPHPVREPLARHHVREVGLHHELGATGGARGRDHHRDVVGSTSAGPLPVGGAASNRPVDVRRPRRSARARPGRRSRRVRRRCSRVHGHLDRADLHEREPRQQVLGGVARGHEHAVARARTLRARNADAARSICSSASAYVSTPSSECSHALPGTSSTAARNIRGIVRARSSMGVTVACQRRTWRDNDVTRRRAPSPVSVSTPDFNSVPARSPVSLPPSTTSRPPTSTRSMPSASA